MDPPPRRLSLPGPRPFRVFRGKVLEALHIALRDDPLVASGALRALRDHEWVVYAKKPLAGPRHTLDYLARYTHRVALTNDRLLGWDNGIVRLRWRDYAHGGKKKVLHLHPVDLLGRFVLHVFPRGFRRVRHYGLLGNRHRSAKLAACRRYFGIASPTPTDAHVAVTTRLLHRVGVEPGRCPSCGSPRILREFLAATPPFPRARAPTRADR